MELKKWNEYSVQEKKDILYYWWNDYKRRLPVYQEWDNERFAQIIDMDIDLVFAMLVMLYQSNITSQGLVFMMNGSHDLCIILNKTLEFRTAGNKFGYFDRLSDEFLKKLIEEFNKDYPTAIGPIEEDSGIGSM